MIFCYLKGVNRGVTADKVLSYPSLCKAQYKTVKSSLIRSFPNLRGKGGKVSFRTNKTIKGVRFLSKTELV